MIETLAQRSTHLLAKRLNQFKLPGDEIRYIGMTACNKVVRMTFLTAYPYDVTCPDCKGKS